MERGFRVDDCGDGGCGVGVTAAGHIRRSEICNATKRGVDEVTV